MLRRTWLGIFVLVGLAAAPARAQSQLPTTTDDVVVLAKDRLKIGLNVQLESGQIVVNDLGGVASVCRSFSTIPDLLPQFAADTVQVRPFGRGVGPQFFDLFANRLDDSKNSTVVLGAGPLPIDPQSFPLLPFPTPVTVTPGTADVIVKPVNAETLPAGDYGNIRMRRSSQLFFDGGTYNIKSLRAASHARIRFNGPTTLNITDRFKLGTRATLGPAIAGGPSALNSRCIVINYTGIRTVHFGRYVDVTATVNAPNAFMSFGRAGIYRGNFAAAEIRIGRQTVLQDESPLSGPCL